MPSDDTFAKNVNKQKRFPITADILKLYQKSSSLLPTVNASTIQTSIHVVQ